MFENILITTDGSKHSEKAAEKGLEMARLSKGKVTALYVADIGRYAVPGDMSYNIADEVLRGMKSSVLAEGESAIKRIEDKAKEAGVSFEGKVIEGHPADDILKFAKKAKIDLIVIGSIGKTGLEKFLLGSVAEKVVRSSKVPVMVVRGA